MAIDKKLIHFKTKETFNNVNDSGEILDSSIAFIKDSSEIYTHGTSYKFINWSKLTNEVP